ncbi:hypothetical protein CAter282_0365 [Collimonas arenae]|uniref:Uncharacterized protein n=1 Tax=Collimonas arenae TaxID=279058 RepID=A0A127QDN1_9BURK|nr:hypothetical protein [Collimonas arenae]AMP08183.1 hypothetical protein CAter282_0365 [Collimonas arenae]
MTRAPHFGKTIEFNETTVLPASGERRWSRWALACVALLQLMSPASHAQMRADLPANKAAAAGPKNLLAEAARSIGVKQCQPAITRLSALAINGTRSHDVLVDWDRAHPDRGPFFSLTGIEYAGASAAVSITAVPQDGGACSVSAERISIAPYSCKSIADTELKGYSATALLPTFTVYVSPTEPGGSVSLVDSPPGCLIIRRYVQYNWTEQTKMAVPAR